MFCIKCGNRLDENMKFCDQCGAPVPVDPDKLEAKNENFCLLYTSDAADETLWV